MMFPNLMVYIAEISSKEMRGSLSNAVNIFQCVGLCLTYTLAIFLPWRSNYLCPLSSTEHKVVTQLCPPGCQYTTSTPTKTVMYQFFKRYRKWRLVYLLRITRTDIKLNLAKPENYCHFLLLKSGVMCWTLSLKESGLGPPGSHHPVAGRPQPGSGDSALVGREEQTGGGPGEPGAGQEQLTH